ncbi:MAG: ribonucleoside-diphosphate reductase, adenosylcobalamin-dependent [Caldisphaera sp.]|jgi:ribonucleotide reductase alpha subunit|nr:MAG: ribonucleoside-diphosphate reductase, adenosylcobalamin-dependent [Caldisphaera sp.]PMP88243.1 MAG: ribonucleoside-diphosphate reductase, adenosylcobalamin-dependent [Caldisphaera sp.]
MTNNELKQLQLIKESTFKPEIEKEARKLLLKEIYEDVTKWYSKNAPNGGRLADLPQCVKDYLEDKRNEPCEDDIVFTYNAIKVLQSRYIIKSPFLTPMETPSMVMRRVAEGFSSRVDKERLYNLLIQGKFMFNSPTLFNMFVDGAKGALSACYVTPVFDSMEGILDGVKTQALTFKYGGGQGFSFSELRPRGDIVAGTSGVASGPLSFMRLYDVATDVVKQGGKRRGANMGILHVWHPDIYNPDYDPWQALSNTLPPQVKMFIKAIRDAFDQIEKDGSYEVNPILREMADRLSKDSIFVPEDAGFIQAKKSPMQDSFLTNFNISVGINDAFMKSVIEGNDWWMVNPRYSKDSDGIYRIHYSISNETSLGRIGKLIKENKWLLENPYLNIFEDVMEKAKSIAINDLIEGKKEVDFSKRNTRAWKINARLLWEEIIKSAWEGGDPGLIFSDNHNKWNPTPWLGTVTATNPCVVGNTRVLTPSGFIKIEDLYNNLKILVPNNNVMYSENVEEDGDKFGYPLKILVPNNNVMYSENVEEDGDKSLAPNGNSLLLVKTKEKELRIDNLSTIDSYVWKIGTKKVYKIIFNEGLELEATGDHRVLTDNGFKEVLELKPGDMVKVARIDIDQLSNYGIKYFNGVKLTKELGFILGWLVGNGYIKEESKKVRVDLYFNATEEYVAKMIINYIWESFGYKPKLYKSNGKLSLTINNGKVAEILKMLMKGDTIPEVVYRASPEFVKGFLSGLFSVNSYVDNYGTIRLKSPRIELLKEVQKLLTLLGIQSTIDDNLNTKILKHLNRNGETKEYNSHKYYELMIRNYSKKVFADKVTLIKHKQEKLMGTLSMISMDKPFVTVKEVVYVGEKIVYDTTVPKLHYYVTNSIISHNCGEQHLYPFESCNLGSIDVSRYINNGTFDLESFSKDLPTIVDSMDAVIDLNKHPDRRQTLINSITRKIGLGIMGLANALALLGYPYDSDEAVAFTLITTAAIEIYAWKRSWELGAKLGHAPAFECKRWDWKEMKCVEKALPEETLPLHTPALLKAKDVMKFEDSWLKVKYHDVKIPEDIMKRLLGETANRIEQDGSIKLIKEDRFYEVLKIFGITNNTFEEIRDRFDINNSRHLLALALIDPEKAWEVLKTYGKSIGARAPRNTVVNTVAPTGTISIISGTSSGIEPYFALVYLRRVAVGEFWETIAIFRDKILELSKKYNLSEDFLEGLFKLISNHKGSIRWALNDIEKFISEYRMEDKNGKITVKSGFDYSALLNDIRKLANLFPTSMDFDIWYHASHQIASQIYTDQAISKTINLPSDANLDAVFSSYLIAWLGGLKGVTIYRDESKGIQVIYFGGEAKNITIQPIKPKKKSRMILIRKEMKISDVESDRKLSQLFGLSKDSKSGIVSVKPDENSTCKTCDL